MVKDGVIDPTKVVRSALQNAASVATLLLTSDALVAEMPKDEKKPAAAAATTTCTNASQRIESAAQSPRTFVRGLTCCRTSRRDHHTVPAVLLGGINGLVRSLEKLLRVVDCRAPRGDADAYGHVMVPVEVSERLARHRRAESLPTAPGGLGGAGITKDDELLAAQPETRPRSAASPIATGIATPLRPRRPRRARTCR